LEAGVITFSDLKEIRNIDDTVIALGNFDGMHTGHTELIRKTAETARRRGMKSAVFTFTGNPRNVIEGKTLIRSLLSPADKEEIIGGLGIDYLFSLPFSEDVRRMTPEEFIEGLLLGVFRAREVFCGFNYRFGAGRAGSLSTLREAAAYRGFALNVLKPVVVEGKAVSSSMIREIIAKGMVDECRKYMGRNYSIAGKVVSGNRIGRTIGFPTCNLLIDGEMASPARGVYVTTCFFGGHTFPGVTNFGIRPTIGDGKKTAETHLFDFEGDLYGKEIRVEFLKKIRDEIKFDNVGQLAAQIAADIRTARGCHLARQRGPAGDDSGSLPMFE
jgi:riboflavin kinase/FMN adenylyltransferase